MRDRRFKTKIKKKKAHLGKSRGQEKHLEGFRMRNCAGKKSDEMKEVVDFHFWRRKTKLNHIKK